MALVARFLLLPQSILEMSGLELQHYEVSSSLEVTEYLLESLFLQDSTNLQYNFVQPEGRLNLQSACKHLQVNKCQLCSK